MKRIQDKPGGRPAKKRTEKQKKVKQQENKLMLN